MREPAEIGVNLYFAYGSNMSTPRITDNSRCPDALFYKVATLNNWELVFNKRKGDGTGAANVREKLGSKVLGVIFSLNSEDLNRLDGAEGYNPSASIQKHYDRQKINVDLGSGEFAEAWIYLADPTMPTLAPSDLYLKYLINGAVEHGFTDDYIAFLKSHATS
jgi:gamma-glutamylcyclotransferase (GGCT)/AIG2-like uncharacterized protein YtfP